MLISWRYRERKTFIQSLDPRARLIFFGAFMISLLSFWDLRILTGLLMIGVLQMLLARVPWRDTRRAWLFMITIAIFFTLVTFLTGRGGFEYYQTEHILTTLYLPKIFGWQPSILVTAERIAYALSQLERILAVTTFAVTIPYTLDPRLYGITFRGLGLPDKFAYAMDLAFRFVPTISRDFTITYDAQRARGYEMEKLSGGIVSQLRRVAPLLVPVVIQAIIGGEEIIDAMDLRSFGVGPRTWLPQLNYRLRDKILVAASILLVVVSIALSFWGYGKFWTPEFLIRL